MPIFLSFDGKKCIAIGIKGSKTLKMFIYKKRSEYFAII